MKNTYTVFSFILITVAYIGVFYLFDIDDSVIEKIASLTSIIPALLMLTFVSWVCRYIRWRVLLRRADVSMSFYHGLLVYLSGFAFTATPGKVGELTRSKYFNTIRDKEKIFSVFLFERSQDLIVVLLLSTMISLNSEYIFYALLFVLLVVGSLIFLLINPSIFIKIARYINHDEASLLILLSRRIEAVLRQLRYWINTRDIFISFVYGCIAWSVLSIAFVLLITHIEVTLPINISFSIYPLSMLVGAASMLPGGVGTTESTIVLLMLNEGVDLGTATLAAIGIRFITLWSAIIVGFISILVLEFKKYFKLSYV